VGEQLLCIYGKLGVPRRGKKKDFDVKGLKVTKILRVGRLNLSQGGKKASNPAENKQSSQPRVVNHTLRGVRRKSDGTVR